VLAMKQTPPKTTSLLFSSDRKHTLGYLRIAKKATDSYNGLLYRHGWPTGYQDLIFQSESDAIKFITNVK
jgi:hypothetical protein